MKLIGLTGGIGSGKSTVARMFEEYGIPVYYADDEAKRLMAGSPEIRSALIKTFGDESFKDGELNRKYLADMVFNNPEKLRLINAIVHPAVRKDFENWAKLQKTDWVIQENAILFESGMDKRFDKIISVTAPEVVRIKRVMQRDGVQEQQVLERMQNQWPETEKISRSDYVIRNTNLTETRKHVKKIIADLNNFTS